jgi:spore coat protein CotH
MKTIYLLVKNVDKTYFNRAGVAFAPNKDGSVNFKLDLFPNVTFQMREKDEKDT